MRTKHAEQSLLVAVIHCCESSKQFTAKCPWTLTELRDSNNHIHLYQAFNLGENKAWPPLHYPFLIRFPSLLDQIVLGSYPALDGWHRKPHKPTPLCEVPTLSHVNGRRPAAPVSDIYYLEHRDRLWEKNVTDLCLIVFLRMVHSGSLYTEWRAEDSK